MKALTANPYRIFFSLGTIGLFVGIFVWLITGINNELYFGRMHAHYMMGIFLLSFVIGFLMTAIPRMSGSKTASETEIIIQLIPMLSAAFWGVFENDERYFFLSLIVSILVLFRFCFLRIIKCRHVVPDVFPMVIIGLLSGFSGAILSYLGHTEIGARLFYLNFVLCLCVGIGSKLVPMLLRINQTKSHPKEEFWTVGLLLTGACFIEIYLSEGYGNFLRAAVMTLVFFRYWKAWYFKGQNSSVSWGIRLAAVSMLLGTIGLWLFPDYRLEAIHLLYVSGFGLLTLMIASRVILAHGNHDLQLEFGNWFINIPVGMIVFAAATRVAAAFVDGGYERHLAYAAFIFLSGFGLWCYFFVPKLLGYTGKRKASLDDIACSHK